MAITGKPLAATAGAKMFERGGNAVDAACAMLAAGATMHDSLGWGGETQALIYNPNTGKVVGINALGAAPTGATAELFKSMDLKYPPDEGPLAAVTPGTPGGLMVMLAEFGTMSLKEVLAPSMQLAEGYPIEAQLVDSIAKNQEKLAQWPYSKALFMPHENREHAFPEPGEIFKQLDLLDTLGKLVDAEAEGLKAGLSRKEAIMAAYDRFYRGDIASEIVRSAREQGGLFTMEDLADWSVKIEEPVVTRYKGIEVCKLTTWVQGPAMLQCLNMLEDIDLKSMGYNSARYIHALTQVMNLAFADRDFYYGDPYFPPREPIEGLLSRDYGRDRLASIDWEQNNPDTRPGDPYPYQGENNPFPDLLENWSNIEKPLEVAQSRADLDEAFRRGTTSIQAAGKDGWAVSITPSGGWIPSVIAGKTGFSLSQRMQSFVLDPSENPFNVVEPGKRPRATLTPTIALKDGKPFLCFSVQGGDTQDQNLLQFFLNIVEFDMTVQEACEAANITNGQMRSSFGKHVVEPGLLTLVDEVPSWVRKELVNMGYHLNLVRKNSGPITAIQFDEEHGTLWGGASNHGEDHGIAW
ncbi:MAG: gamma-glutamyltranspeptidase/glutathione hydrolase [Candidatus Pelagisphaera sp.]|jgi:gamma-glutamyltranspeptidase/glutathione hydrolase